MSAHCGAGWPRGTGTAVMTVHHLRLPRPTRPASRHGCGPSNPSRVRGLARRGHGGVRFHERSRTAVAGSALLSGLAILGLLAGAMVSTGRPALSWSVRADLRPVPRPVRLLRVYESPASRAERRAPLLRTVTAMVGVGPTFFGLASWYGPGFDGHRTASGSIFDEAGFSAASRTLPLGSLLSVCYAGTCVVVVVNDRGPAPLSRVLDLSRGAAAAIGLLPAGVGEVSATPVASRTVTIGVVAAAPPVAVVGLRVIPQPEDV